MVEDRQEIAKLFELLDQEVSYWKVLRLKSFWRNYTAKKEVKLFPIVLMIGLINIVYLGLKKENLNGTNFSTVLLTLVIVYFCLMSRNLINFFQFYQAEIQGILMEQSLQQQKIQEQEQQQ